MKLRVTFRVKLRVTFRVKLRVTHFGSMVKIDPWNRTNPKRRQFPFQEKKTTRTTRK